MKMNRYGGCQDQRTLSPLGGALFSFAPRRRGEKKGTCSLVSITLYTTGNPAERRCYIPAETVERLLSHCPNLVWRLLLVLARFAGCRAPSEPFSLKWSDVLWEEGRLVIDSPTQDRPPNHAPFPKSEKACRMPLNCRTWKRLYHPGRRSAACRGALWVSERQPSVYLGEDHPACRCGTLAEALARPTG